MTFFLEDPVGQNWFQPIIVQNIEHHGPTCGDCSRDRGFGSQEVLTEGSNLNICLVAGSKHCGCGII